MCFRRNVPCLRLWIFHVPVKREFTSSLRLRLLCVCNAVLFSSQYVALLSDVINLGCHFLLECLRDEVMSCFVVGALRWPVQKPRPLLWILLHQKSGQSVSVGVWVAGCNLRSKRIHTVRLAPVCQAWGCGCVSLCGMVSVCKKFDLALYRSRKTLAS